jgi:hypothetical protein
MKILFQKFQLKKNSTSKGKSTDRPLMSNRVRVLLSHKNGPELLNEATRNCRKSIDKGVMITSDEWTYLNEHLCD